MSFKSILGVVGHEQDETDLELGIDLCAESGAHLSALVVALAPPPPVSGYNGIVPEFWLEERQGGIEKLENRAASIKALLAGQPISSDVAAHYLEAARASEAVGLRARYADLTLIGPSLLANERLRESVVEGALFHSGKPVLLVPRSTRPTLQPKRAAIAWDGRVEAVRAVREALPLLGRAEEVRLVLVDPQADSDSHGVEPGADLAAYLARHDVRVTVDRLPGMGRSVAEVIRGHAVDMAADLLVMGAYGHSRLRERIFGGVTRSMLAEPPVPILMAR